jgi:putative CocE/NonD family hydrolase
MRALRWALVLAVVCAIHADSAFGATRNLCNVPITMSDGVVLRANVFLPAQTGRSPTVLTVTGYNKDPATPPYCEPGAGSGVEDPDMIPAGYAVMVLDERGTGASGGQWDSWGARTQQDYQEVLDWIQRQPWSNGSVGDYGGSYMAITSLLVAEADARRVAAGKPRAVKAVWAELPMADAYRDVTFHGGAVDAGFIPLWLGLTTAESDIPPSTLVSDPASALDTYPGHLANGFQFAAQQILSMTTGGDAAYDGPFYQLRSPVTRIASLRIPVAWVGGWWDIFQRGEPLLFEKMKNSPHKVWFQMPRYHSAPDPSIWTDMHIGTQQEVTHRWFDRWLKGADNGIQSLPDVNLYTMGANRWEHPSTWPPPNARYTPYYLSGDKSGSSTSLNDGTLSTTRPTAPGGDSEPLLPASSPCSRMTFQWTAGIVVADSCQTDNSSYEASSLTYTTPPLQRDTEVTGPVLAHVWAELSGASDATLVGVLSDVNPQGQSTQLTAGFLQASQRAVDPKLSTYADGVMNRPWHPFTRASQEPVTPNEPTLYEIEVYPTSNVFKAGDRIRLTIGTANTPSTATPVTDLQNQAGGQLRILRGPTHGSYVQLPAIPTGSVPTGGCPQATGRLAGARLGLARLGMTRRQVRRAFAKSTNRATRDEDAFCLMPAGVRVGYATPKLLRTLGTSRRAHWRGRVVRASTANPFYSLRGVRPGMSLRAASLRLGLGRAFRAGRNRWYFGAAGHARPLLEVRHGIVKEIGIAAKALTAGRAAQGRFIAACMTR